MEADAGAAHALDFEAWRLRREAAKQAKELFADAPPRLRQFTVDDVTAEAFLVDLAANDGRLAVCVDELRTHLRAMGRYRVRGDGGEHARWLSLWAGGVVQYRRRAMDAQLRVDHPVVPVLGGLQPHLLSELGDDEDGSRARWLPHHSDRSVLHTQAAEEPQDWRAFVEQTFTISAPRRWHLDDASRRVWEDARRRWEVLARQPDSASSVVGAAAKAASQSLRVALVCAELLHSGGGGPVPPEALSAGIAIADYAVGTWAALGGSVEHLATSWREEKLGRGADRLAAWVASKGGRVTRRDALRAHACGVRSAAKLDEVLVEYRKFFPGTVRDEELPGGGPKTLAIYAPRDPRPYGTRRSTLPLTALSPIVVATGDNDGRVRESELDRDASSQVEVPPGGITPDHNVVASAGGDNDLATTHESDYPIIPRAYSDNTALHSGVLHPIRDYSDTSPLATDSEKSAGSRPEVFTATPVLIDSTTEFERILPEILAAGTVGLDLETTGLDPLADAVRTVQLAVSVDHAYVLDARRVPVKVLQPILDRSVILGHNLGFDLGFLAANGLRLPVDIGPRLCDTMLAEQLLTAGSDEFRRVNLADTVARRLEMQLDKTEQAGQWSADALTDAQLSYAAADAAALLPLWGKQAAEVTDADLNVAMGIEMCALPAIVWTEISGVRLDPDRLADLAEAAQADLRAATAALNALVDRPVNWRSPKQIQELLAALGIEVASTAENVLVGIGHPIAAALLNHRHAQRLVSMYGDGRFGRRISPATGRIHADYRQIGSVAGRMSCTKPPMQTVSSDRRYRDCFRAAPGRVLVKADYSQIELRIAAVIAQDAALLEAFAAGQDVHALTAASVLGRPGDADARQAAKAVGFGLIYGMGAPRLAQYARQSFGVEISEAEAAEYWDRFFAKHDGLRRWQWSRPEGYVATRTLAGRRRLHVARFTEKLNTPVQGSGADGLKRAIGLLWERQDQCPGAVPVLIVHDEIVVECDAEAAEQAEAWLRNAMVDGMHYVVPDVSIEVDITVGPSWAKGDAS